MISRRLISRIEYLLQASPAVVLLGPRQVGKTTLAKEVAAHRPSVYLDMEEPGDRNKLERPTQYFEDHAGELVIIDEIQRLPEIFQILRGVIDRGRQGQGKPNGRFLLLGSAAMDLLRQTSESLAGRIAFVELGPFDIAETGPSSLDPLWVRGGFPCSFLAESDVRSFEWRRDFIQTYLERDIPQFGSRVAAETLRRFWTMLAHNQARIWNAADLARSLGVDGKSVAGYVDLLVDLLLVRKLQPWRNNAGKRLVKAPKVYVRDTGIAHALLGIRDKEELLSHPVAGQTWESFVTETLIATAPEWTEPSYYRTSHGVEVDLLLSLPGRRLWAIEIKLSSTPKVEKGFHAACAALNPEKQFVVYPGAASYPLDEKTRAIGLAELAGLLRTTVTG